MQRETTRTVETTQHAGRHDHHTARETTRTVKTARVTYAQDWPAYNAAQTHEKGSVRHLLHALCRGIKEPPPATGTGPAAPAAG
jgi:hypothetical protein